MNETLQQIAERHGFSPELAQTLLSELQRSRGRQVTFNDPALGGVGQWRGGILLIGDMMNHGLKAKVSAFLNDLAAHAHASPVDSIRTARRAERAASAFQAQASGQREAGFSMTQNGVSYKYSANRNELIVNGTDVYDTTGLRVMGISSIQQNGQGVLVLRTDQGEKQISDLTRRQ
ncbi:MAG: hypothetical protein LH606_11720 [Cytophagaceae bacterium]|nr:hypothetical protein [Cytophagaceae bacterium]